MTKIREQVEAKYKLLPDDVKEAIDQLDPTEAVGEIGRKFNLHVDQIGLLADEIGSILLGFDKPADFVANLKKALGLPDNQINAIATNVNELIFLKIRESLQKLHVEQKLEIAASKPPVNNSVFEKKMGELFRLPREEIELDQYNEPLK